MSCEPGTACTAEVLIETASRLPASPQVLAELNELLLDPHLRVDDVVALLRRDTQLGGSVVKVANSVLYSGPRVGSIEDAVLRVGMNEVFQAVSLATTVRCAEMALPCYGLPAGRLSRTMLLHALATESLAALTGLDPRVAYTTGLLRPLGLMVINQLMRPRCDTLRPATNSRDLLAAEREWVGRTNPEVAALVLEHWNFSPEVVSGVREHYLLAGWQEASRLAIALNVAGAMVMALGAALKPERDLWMPNPAKLAALGLDEEQLLAAQERTRLEYDRLRCTLE
jgi:HD-like signal output (HDOD) protein